MGAAARVTFLNNPKTSETRDRQCAIQLRLWKDRGSANRTRELRLTLRSVRSATGPLPPAAALPFSSPPFPNVPASCDLFVSTNCSARRHYTMNQIVPVQNKPR